jgi:non-haem Fe2+, alpha-ketoglutarate-dependent halogenase
MTHSERYRQDGILFPVPVLSAGEVASCQAALLELESRLVERGLGDPKRIPLPHLGFRWAYDLATHPAVVDAVEAVLGPDVVVQATLILTKPPGDPAVVTWHQDGTYSGLHRSPNTTAWIALWDSTPENGCMRVVPGSHQRPILPHVASREEHHLLRHSPEIAVEVDESEAVDVTLRAGEMSLHHSNIIHGSRPNRSTERRTGFIVRFVTPAMPASDRPVLRVRGGGDLSHLPQVGEQRPPAELDAGLDLWSTRL